MGDIGPDTEELVESRALISEIIEAFQDVRLGSGIGLWEAQAIDDYAKEEDRAKARHRDETSDWLKIPSESLMRCESSLCFFDTDGMRFHLSAFMVDHINRTLARMENTDSAMYSLTAMNSHKRLKFTTFNYHQKLCIVNFLKWYLKYDFPTEDDKNAIIKSLSDDWRM